MANEINVGAQLTITNGLKVSLTPQTILSLSSSSSPFDGIPQILNTGSWTQISASLAATPITYLLVQNNPINNTGSIVNIATNSSGTNSFASIKPGGFMLLPGSGSITYYATAVSASVQLLTAVC